MSSVVVVPPQVASAASCSCLGNCIDHEARGVDVEPQKAPSASFEQGNELAAQSYLRSKRRRSSTDTYIGSEPEFYLPDTDSTSFKRFRAGRNALRDDSCHDYDANGAYRNQDHFRSDSCRFSSDDDMPSEPSSHRNLSEANTSVDPDASREDAKCSLANCAEPKVTQDFHSLDEGRKCNFLIEEVKSDERESTQPLARDNDAKSSIVSRWSELLIMSLRESSSYEDAESRTKSVVNDFISYIYDTSRASSGELRQSIQSDSQKRLEQVISEKQVLARGMKILHEKLQVFQASEAANAKEIDRLNRELLMVSNNYQKLKDAIQIYMYNMNVEPHQMRFHERPPPDVY